MARLKQNSIGSMEDLANNLSKPGVLVVGLFSDMFMIANSSLELPRNRRIVARKSVFEFFAESTEVLAETYVGQALSKESDISSTDEAVFGRKIVVRALEAL